MQHGACSLTRGCRGRREQRRDWAFTQLGPGTEQDSEKKTCGICSGGGNGGVEGAGQDFKHLVASGGREGGR